MRPKLGHIFLDGLDRRIVPVSVLGAGVELLVIDELCLKMLDFIFFVEDFLPGAHVMGEYSVYRFCPVFAELFVVIGFPDGVGMPEKGDFGRLMPQAVYYIYAYSRLSKGKIIFCVPSGNFGNLMGGVLAKEMGLPVEKFIVAVNENDEFPSFLKTGEYEPVVPSRNCSSNAMNVGHPSNLARLIDLYGGWLFDERDEKGKGNKES